MREILLEEFCLNVLGSCRNLQVGFSEVARTGLSLTTLNPHGVMPAKVHARTGFSFTTLGRPHIIAPAAVHGASRTGVSVVILVPYCVERLKIHDVSCIVASLAALDCHGSHQVGTHDASWENYLCHHVEPAPHHACDRPRRVVGKSHRETLTPRPFSELVAHSNNRPILGEVPTSRPYYSVLESTASLYVYVVV